MPIHQHYWVPIDNEAHYGLFDVSGQDLKTALRQAEDMVTFAEKVLNR